MLVFWVRFCHFIRQLLANYFDQKRFKGKLIRVFILDATGHSPLVKSSLLVLVLHDSNAFVSCLDLDLLDVLSGRIGVHISLVVPLLVSFVQHRNPRLSFVALVGLLPKSRSFRFLESLWLGHSVSLEHVVMVRDDKLGLIGLSFFISYPHELTIFHLFSNSRFGVLGVCHILQVLLLNRLQVVNNSI